MAKGTQNPFTGSWTLCSYELRGSDGSVERPLGRAPIGRLMYDEHGRMSGQCLNPSRRSFKRSNAARGSDAEIREAFGGYIAYYGAYRVNEKAGTVSHRVEGSLFPNWVGTTMVRHYEFRGKELILRTPPIRTGTRTVVGTLVWKREA